MDPKRSRQLLPILKRIPLFEGLSPTDLQKFVIICRSRILQDGDKLFGRGEASDEMFVLLTGCVSMLRQDGVEMARFEPVAPLGEVGLVTARPRRVDMCSRGESRLLVLPRMNFEKLLASDLRMAVSVYRNIIRLISTRVDEDHVRAFEHEEVRARLARVEGELGLAFEAMAEAGLDPGAVREKIDGTLSESQPTVLIVDDEPGIRQFLSAALAEYDVITAADGVAALEAAQQRTPNLVIADVKMPNMDGLELLSRLKEKRPELPVIGLSGYVEPEESGNLGFDDFVRKPMQVAALRDLVRTRLQNAV